MQTRPGYKTTEFWLSLAAMILGAVAASGLLELPNTPAWAVQIVGIVSSVLGGLGYTVNRSGVKKAEANAVAALAAKSPSDPS